MAYLELIIAAAAAFLLGFGWYTALFGKAWQEETGLTSEQAQSNMGRTHGLAFLMMVILAYALNYIIGFHPVEEQTFTHGMLHGAMAAALYAVPAVAIHYLYQRKSLKLFLIDGVYVIAFMALMGGVLAALKLG
ncbi:MAG: DUF1761 domain-containing protein [Saprospiraceae bacterium]|nr:DUF1761 domain-containing protein [Saprospiraceae bacterium]